MLKLYRNVVAVGLVGLGLAACGDKVTVTQPVTPVPGVTSVSVAPANLTIAINQQVQYAASVIADVGVATTVTWASGNAAIATVDANGMVKGITAGTTTITASSTADAGKKGIASVTVSATPVSMLSFTISPTVATLAPGNFVQISPTFVMAPGVAAPTPTYATSNAAKATVSATGLVTAVDTGAVIITATAVSGTSTLTATLGVTVRPLVAATVSISSVTTGILTLPVTLSNVNGQIEVNLNFNPGEQVIDSIAVFLGGTLAAKQSYVTNPAAGIITLSINTAAFTKNYTLGTATVAYQNGNSSIVAKIYPQHVATATATQITPIQLNNADGWAADITKPTNSAVSAGGLTYWGGPTAPASATIYPVIYTLNRSISTVSWTIGAPGFSSCSTVIQTTAPFRTTFGTSGATGCPYENVSVIRDNIIVSNALDNSANTYPLVNAATPLIPNSVVLAACLPATAGCVLGSTPDSLRLDYVAPSVNTPDITRTAPAVTGWVNAGFSFINFASADAGVGLRAVRDRTVTYTSDNCLASAAVDAAMPTGTGADINGGVACPDNSIGGAPGLGGTAPWDVIGHESDRLGNVGSSSETDTFGTDYTAPSIRWGVADAGIPVLAAVNQAGTDTIFKTAKPTTQTFRAEALDERSGFDIPTAEVEMMSTAGHANPTGSCVIGTGVPGATFVTSATCGLVTVASIATVRLDGWRAGADVLVPTNEGYYGYRAMFTDRAGNASATIFRRLLVNTNNPFSTGLGVPAVLTASAFNFLATFSDSVEVINQSLQVVYPLVPGATDSLRYTQAAIGAAFDDFITSPFAGNIAPPLSAPYVRGIEVVNGTAFPGSNVGAYPGTTAKPIKVEAWAWNPSNFFSASPEIGIPTLNVQDGTGIAAFNAANPTMAVVHFRIISTVATSNQFGSTTPLRAQVVAPTNSPNAPFSRVDFYRLDGGATWYNYLGSVAGGSAIPTDQGTYRSWVYALPNASFVNTWNGTAAGAVASTNVIIAVGVISNGDAISTVATTMIP